MNPPYWCDTTILLHVRLKIDPPGSEYAMADATADKIVPNQEMTTVARAPRTSAAEDARASHGHADQRGRKKLRAASTQGQRDLYRAGRKWVNRCRTTKIAIAEPGSSFTLHTPQMVNDLQRVELPVHRLSDSTFGAPPQADNTSSRSRMSTGRR